MLEAFSANNSWQFETIQDLGSGLNSNKRGLQKLLKRIMQDDVGWFISFRLDVERQISVSDSIVGIDLGIKALATLSTGEVVLGAKSYKKPERKQSRIQRLSCHKVKDSNNGKKSQTQIARLHKKIANIRKYSLHKLATLLAKNHGTVVIEDLNVSGMLANHKLAKSIASLSFFE